jgi:hypothetical protein
MRLCLFLGSGEILFSLYLFILCGSLENDHLSPQRGKQPKGSISLTPSFFRIYFTLIRSFRNRGAARAEGAEA